MHGSNYRLKKISKAILYPEAKLKGSSRAMVVKITEGP